MTNKAKIGDGVVLTQGSKTALYDEWNGKEAVVVEIKKGKIWVKSTNFQPEDIGLYWIEEGCYELAPYVNSPLYEALK